MFIHLPRLSRTCQAETIHLKNRTVFAHPSPPDLPLNARGRPSSPVVFSKGDLRCRCPARASIQTSRCVWPLLAGYPDQRDHTTSLCGIRHLRCFSAKGYRQFLRRVEPSGFKVATGVAGGCCRSEGIFTGPMNAPPMAGGGRFRMGPTGAGRM